jgi:hypothetical protein
MREVRENGAVPSELALSLHLPGTYVPGYRMPPLWGLESVIPCCFFSSDDFFLRSTASFQILLTQ